MIEVRDLWKSYGSFHALLGISFNVRRGEILGFLGPNGAGKSTAMKILTGFMYPSRGTVTVGGLDVVEKSIETRRLIGYLPEHTPLYPDMSVREYLRFCAQLRGMPSARARSRIDEVVQLTTLTPKWKAGIKTLSKGYRQRVGIAQALLHEPDVLILDEPTVGLDPNQVVPVRQIIRDVGRDRTVILCSHILSEVEAVCGRVVIINEGTIVGDGTPRELAEKLSSSRIFEVRGKGDAEAARAALASVPGVVSVDMLPTGGDAVAARVTVDAGAQPGRDIARAFDQRDVALTEIASRSAGLEDVFRQLTASTGVH